ncbi:hypothetical protein J437_LFUL017997 [Ladona fulva]|uniref:Uncharacterized protein n=1 Tax=Ladona fulva TaxID=123851 RepID=A0A8K0P8S2_LADFU|nr:hypothetical protein J437_LFUL017997 [Ladona fulva]
MESLPPTHPLVSLSAMEGLAKTTRSPVDFCAVYEPQIWGEEWFMAPWRSWISISVIARLSKWAITISEIAREFGLSNVTTFKYKKWEESPSVIVRWAPGGQRSAVGLNVFWRLRFCGLEARHAAVKEILTPAHKCAHLEVAHRYVNERIEFWTNVIYSDEKTFSSSFNGPVTVYGSWNKRFNPK